MDATVDAPGDATGDAAAVRALRAQCAYAQARRLAQSLAPAADPDLLAELGRLQAEYGECTTAASTLEQALQGAHGAVRERATAWLLGALTDAAQFGVATRRARQALQDYPASARVLAEAGTLAIETSDHSVAEEHLSRAVALATDAEEQVRALTGLADLRRRQGGYSEARVLLAQARQRAESAFGDASIELATVLNGEGVVGKFDGRFDDALEAYTRALAILERALGPYAAPLAAVHHNLGGLAHARRDFAGGEPHGRRSVEIRTAVCGPDHLHVALDKAAWAALLDGLRRSDEAERLLREAIPVIERDLGTGNPELAAQLHNLAAILARRGEVAQAESLYRRSLEIKAAAVGGDGPPLAPTLNNLGLLLKRQGRTGEAARLFRRGLASLEGQVADDHPTLRALRRNSSDLAL